MNTSWAGHDIGLAATRFHRAMRQRVAEALVPHDLSGLDYGALVHIAEHSDISNADLARFLLITPQVLGRTTASLRERGLLTARPAPGTRRRALTLTATGLDVLRTARPDVERAQQDLLQPLDPTEQAALLTALSICADNFERVDPTRKDHPS